MALRGCCGSVAERENRIGWLQGLYTVFVRIIHVRITNRRNERIDILPFASWSCSRYSRYEEKVVTTINRAEKGKMGIDGRGICGQVFMAHSDAL